MSRAAWGLVGVGLGAVLGFLGSWIAYRRTRRDAAKDRRRRDIDETKRLLHMVADAIDVANPPDVSTELAATIVNALSSHSHVMTADEAFAFIGRVRVVVTADDRKSAHSDINEYIYALDRQLAAL